MLLTAFVGVGVLIATHAMQASDVFDRHLHTRELQGVFSSLAELFFQVRRLKCTEYTMTHVARSTQPFNSVLSFCYFVHACSSRSQLNFSPNPWNPGDRLIIYFILFRV